MPVEYNKNNEPYIMWGDSCVRVERDSIENDKFYKSKAENELRETPANVERSLKELRRLLKEDEKLFIPINDDEFLLKFLRPCKFYVNSAHQKIKSFYEFRQTHQELSQGIVPSAVRNPLQHSIINVLSPRDQHGRRVILVEIGEKWNHRLVSPIDLFRTFQVAIEVIMMEPRTQVSGVVVICDSKGMSISQIFQFAPGFAKTCMDWIQDSAPVRFKSFHAVNQPYIFNVFYAIFKPFLSEKIRSRIFFHGSNVKSLLEHIDGRALRKRHGGTLPDNGVSGKETCQLLNYYEEDLKVANSYGYKK